MATAHALPIKGTPLYEREGVVIYLGDCRDILPTLGDETVDLLVTDPPYGVGWQGNYRTVQFAKIEGDDGSLDVPRALALAAPAIRRMRHAYIFGRFDLLPPLVSNAELIWDKCMMGGGDVTSAWGPSHEPIMFATRSRDKGKVNMGRGAIPARLRQGSVLRYPRPVARNVRRHPTEKPVSLLRRLIESSSFPDEIVLDPFMGCGSTLVAAVAEGRRCIGIELDASYAALAVERVERALDAMAALAPELI